MEQVVAVGEKRFTVRRAGTSARKASARVRGSEIIIRIPVHWPREEGFKAFLELEKKLLARLRENPGKFAEPKIFFEHGQRVTLLGKSFSIEAKQGRARSSKARLYGEVVQVTLAVGLEGEERARHVSNLARRVISRSLLPIVQERVKLLNERHFNFPIKRVFLKEAVSLFGSCSEDANINLNFALLFAPQEVMDSVIIHELAHVKEQNHGDTFWALVKNVMPDYEEKSKWLDENVGKLGVLAGKDSVG